MNTRYWQGLTGLSIGDVGVGEIMLVTDPAGARRIESEAADQREAHGEPREWATIGQVFQDGYLTIFRDAVQFPSGATGTYLRGVPGGDSAAPSGVQVVPWTGRHYLLLRNYRHATRRWEWAFPRGFVPMGVKPEAQALVELSEELGDVSVRGRALLGAAAPDSGLLATQIEHWFLTIESPAFLRRAGAAAEAHEAIAGARLIAPDEMWAELAAGKLTDGITITGFALAEAFRRSGAGDLVLLRS